eukprot:7334096-Prymnesium_polylepis.1
MGPTLRSRSSEGRVWSGSGPTIGESAWVWLGSAGGLEGGIAGEDCSRVARRATWRPGLRCGVGGAWRVSVTSSSGWWVVRSRSARTRSAARTKSPASTCSFSMWCMMSRSTVCTLVEIEYSSSSESISQPMKKNGAYSSPKLRAAARGAQRHVTHEEPRAAARELTRPASCGVAGCGAAGCGAAGCGVAGCGGVRAAAISGART